VMGPTNSIEAQFRGRHKHDLFTCKHAGEEWHTQIIGLMEEQRKTNSGWLTEMLQKEIDQVMETKKATKKPRRLL